MKNHTVFEELTDIKRIIEGKTGNQWLNIDEACNYTSLSQSTIRRAIKRGELKVSRRTGRLLFKLNDIDRWLNG